MCKVTSPVAFLMVSNLLILVHGSRSYAATTEPPAPRTIKDARFSHSRKVVASLLALVLVPLGFTEARHHLVSVLRHHLHYLGDGFRGSSHNDPARNGAGSTSQNVALHEPITPLSLASIITSLAYSRLSWKFFSCP